MTEFHIETVKCKPAREGVPSSLPTLLHRYSIMSSQLFSSFMLLNRLLAPAGPKCTEVLLFPQKLRNTPPENLAPLRFFNSRANKGGASLRPIWVTRANVAKHVRPSGEASHVSPASFFFLSSGVT